MMTKTSTHIKNLVLSSALSTLLIFNGVMAQNTAEVLDHITLRVCADPSNLPFSNDAEEGFENKIAQLLAKDLKKEISYHWFPQSQGFVRSTLNAYNCDVIIGISSAHGLVLNTNAYYRSIFSLIYAADSTTLINTLDHPTVKAMKRIGIVAGTPPTNLMLNYGLIDQLAPYHLFVDTRSISIGEQIMQHLNDKTLTAAILWGPIAGYYGDKYAPSLSVSPLTQDDSEATRMSYSITMGVRHGEIEWKRRINRFIKQNQSQINQILEEYHVPMVKQN